MSSVIESIKKVRETAPALALLSSERRNEALSAMAAALMSRSAEILAANYLDVEAARNRLSDVMIDRLILTEARIQGMADGIMDVVKLPDPVGITVDSFERPNGLRIEKRTVPLGVIGIIYESRPNVTSDAAALCFKSGNACILKSGSDAFLSAAKIVDIIRDALRPFGLENAVDILRDNSRAATAELMGAVGLVDALIPRGGAGLIRACVENSKVPCIQTGTGICHVYVDEAADLQMAVDIIVNGKTQRK